MKYQRPRSHLHKQEHFHVLDMTGVSLIMCVALASTKKNRFVFIMFILT